MHTHTHIGSFLFEIYPEVGYSVIWNAPSPPHTIMCLQKIILLPLKLKSLCWLKHFKNVGMTILMTEICSWVHFIGQKHVENLSQYLMTSINMQEIKKNIKLNAFFNNVSWDIVLINFQLNNQMFIQVTLSVLWII